MKQKPKKKVTESVKLDSVVVDKVRDRKEPTGVSISRFFELAATEKLTKEKIKN